MKIDITMQQSGLNKKISRKITRKARLALCRFNTSIQAVTIRITDTNGPKGGIDMQCVVSMKLISVGELVVHGEGGDIFSAVNQCLSRADRVISRSLERRRNTPIRLNRRRIAVGEELL
jgi:putative sigma-54 modulation protein